MFSLFAQGPFSGTADAKEAVAGRARKAKDKLACPFVFETDPHIERTSLDGPLILLAPP